MYKDYYLQGIQGVPDLTSFLVVDRDNHTYSFRDRISRGKVSLWSISEMFLLYLSACFSNGQFHIFDVTSYVL
jgi:hypothetical protein